MLMGAMGDVRPADLAYEPFFETFPYSTGDNMRTGLVCLTIALLLTTMIGCAPAGPAPRSSSEPPGSSSPRATKRVTAAIQTESPSLYNQLNPSGARSPGGAVELLVNSGLTTHDNQGTLLPRLAEAVPTLDNRQWQLSPDGSMDTTWRIRDGAQWHDGAPITSDDFAFTVQVLQDKAVPELASDTFQAMTAVDTSDSRTVVVRWAKPNITADSVFNMPPLPRHLVEKSYLESKATFTEHRYWRDEFVGAGPFKLQAWHQGSHISLEANDRYVLGRPKIDFIDVRFILDSNVLIANIVGGSVDVPLSARISIEQALQIRGMWQDGVVYIEPRSYLVIYPQFIDPTPPVVRDVRFRRAMLQAIDRQQMADTIQAGLVPVADSYVSPSYSQYVAIEPSIVKYDYDPRKATQAIEELGYTRGADGMFRDANAPLSVELRAIGDGAFQEKSLYTIADYWTRVGVATNPVIIPRQRQPEREYRATFPAFEQLRQPNNINEIDLFISSQARLPETNFAGRNYARYRNADWDALIERHRVTIPIGERTQILAQLMRHMTEQLVVMPLFHDADVSPYPNRMINGTPSKAEGAPVTWNAHEWDVK